MAESAQQPDKDEGEPNAKSGPSNPDEAVPSEQDLQDELPGVPAEAEEKLDEDGAERD